MLEGGEGAVVVQGAAHGRTRTNTDRHGRTRTGVRGRSRVRWEREEKVQGRHRRVGDGFS